MDLFLGADFVFPEKVVAAGLADGKAPTPYARGTLVLWARKDSPLQPITIDSLTDKRATSVAIANDLRAPYGLAAVSALKRLKMYDAVKPHLEKMTGKVLDLFQTRRTATVVQRLALITRDGGCTKPGCTVPAYGCQVHHAVKDFAAGGNTNVNDNGLACGADNRLVGTTGGWTTRMNARHEVEWLPPPLLDRGQTRVNTYHHPERLHPPPGGGESGCAAGESVGETPVGRSEAGAQADAGSRVDVDVGRDVVADFDIADPWAPEHHPHREPAPGGPEPPHGSEVV